MSGRNLRARIVHRGTLSSLLVPLVPHLQVDAMASDEQPSKVAKAAPIGPVSGTVVPRFAGAPEPWPFATASQR